MSDMHLGVSYSLSAAVLWAVGTIVFANAARRIGSIQVNTIRMVIAMVLLLIWEQFRNGRALPEATAHTWIYMTASGVIGFFLGDLALFRALVLIGPRLCALMMSLAPIVAAVAGWIWIDETLTVYKMAGMVVTIGGILWVVSERHNDPDGQPIRHSRLGMALALCGAFGQGLGLVVGKVGMTLTNAAGETVYYDALSASQIRVIAGTVCFVLFVFAAGRSRRMVEAFRNGRGMALTTIGAITGPLIGVALLQKSITYIPSGVAQTIVATVPVLILPWLIFVEKEKVSARAILGAVVTVAGVSLLAIDFGA